MIRREYEDPAQTQCSYYLAPVDRQPLVDFKPGQFLTFSLDVAAGSADAAAGQRTITRCYSLSDRPDPAHYRVTIKRVPAPSDHPEFEPGVSSNHFHDHVQVGDVLRVKAPSGHFFIDPDALVPAVLIGGGIGVTPMMSMLRWCLAHQPQRRLHLFYGLATAASMHTRPNSKLWLPLILHCGSTSSTAARTLRADSAETSSIKGTWTSTSYGARCRTAATGSTCADRRR